MSDSGSSGNTNELKSAATRLNTALEDFENTVAQRRQGELKAQALEEQIEVLTASLSAEREKTQTLSEANDSVSERIDELIDSIETMLGSR